MDKPLETQQPLGSQRRITRSQMNTLRYAERGQRTCALHHRQHRIAGPGTESTSTYGQKLGQGGHRNLHMDGHQIEYVDFT
jgi:hypothetical protein